MNHDIPKTPEKKEESFAWHELPGPLVLGFADELGAVFADEGRKVLWYLDLSTMQFRVLNESDVSESRAKSAEPLSLNEGTVFPNGVEAALQVRKAFLEDQIKWLRILDSSEGGGGTASTILDSLEEELGFVNAYFTDVDPRQRELNIGELDEMYKDMQELESEEKEDESLAAR